MAVSESGRIPLKGNFNGNVLSLFLSTGYSWDTTILKRGYNYLIIVTIKINGHFNGNTWNCGNNHPLELGAPDSQTCPHSQAELADPKFREKARPLIFLGGNIHLVQYHIFCDVVCKY